MSSNTYQPIENDNIANQIHGFTIDDGKFILKLDRDTVHVFYFLKKNTKDIIIYHKGTRRRLTRITNKELDKCRLNFSRWANRDVPL